MDASPTGADRPRASHRARRGTAGATARKSARVLGAVSVGLVVCVGTLTGAVGAAPPAASAAAAPSCAFSSPSFGQLVLDVTPGESINVDCKNFPTNHPYLLVEASLLVAVDPNAKPLLEGQATSVPGLLAIIAALPELNALSVAFPTSDSSGVLNYNYTVPTSQPPDPNATCPPTTEELNSGLIGCAVAMIDLESFKPVVVGTFVLSYKGDPLFPADPTLHLSTTHAVRGQRVLVSDIPGAKTFWWLSTLVSLEAGLSGGSGTGPIPVVVRAGGKAISNAVVTPASYDGITFTPPALSGGFIARGHGRENVKVTLGAVLLGFGLSNAATAKMSVTK
jgi:hypothetical protein